MKIISAKQREAAMDCLADALKQDGWIQTRTVGEWVDEAELHPAQFQTSSTALQVLSALGFDDEVVQARALT